MAYDLVVRESVENIKYISLAEGAEYSGYSQDYLRFRIRQGKLKARKIGRNWLTCQEWLDEYLHKVADYKEKVQEIKSKKGKVLLQSDEEEKKEETVVEAPATEEEAKEPSIDEEQAQFLSPVFGGETEKEEALASVENNLPAYNIQQNPKPSHVDDKLHLFINPKPMAVFQEECEEAPQANPGWVKYAFAVLFLCGILGFVIGFNYSSIKPVLANIGSFGIKQGEEMVKIMVSPLFSEQFTASFGIIFKQSQVFEKKEINNINVDLPPAPLDANIELIPDEFRGPDLYQK